MHHRRAYLPLLPPILDSHCPSRLPITMANHHRVPLRIATILSSPDPIAMALHHPPTPRTTTYRHHHHIKPDPLAGGGVGRGSRQVAAELFLLTGGLGWEPDGGFWVMVYRGEEP